MKKVNSTTMKPLISIITPTYNSENSIIRTINSILNQNYNHIEYIIIDGGSSDATIEIATSFKEKFKQKSIIFKYVSEVDRGISDAFNKGIELATGELIGIVNSDDWLEVDCLSNVINNIDSKHNIYCGDINIYDSTGTFLKKRKSRPSLLWFGMYVMHPTVFVNKEVYKNARFDISFKIAMDFDLLLRLKINGHQIKRIKKTLSNMCLGGISSDIKKMREEEKRIMKKNLPSGTYLIARIIIGIDWLYANTISKLR